ncbi:MAG TPA: hypothetical protein DEP87_02525 [Candidatus Pacebacteria bacterium]|nr:hypothetical protein [Candidatus Paceibacterota bacterium]
MGGVTALAFFRKHSSTIGHNHGVSDLEVPFTTSQKEEQNLFNWAVWAVKQKNPQVRKAGEAWLRYHRDE